MNATSHVLTALARARGNNAERIDAERQNGVFNLPGLYEDSVCADGNELFAVIRLPREKHLAIAGGKNNIHAGFTGETVEHENCVFTLCPLTAGNAAALRRRFAWCAPQSLAGRAASIGCGDRLGKATGGHLRAVRRRRIAPVLAQQSIRELTLTRRTFQNVLDDVTFYVFRCGFRDGYGADGDHLKTHDDIRTAIEAGMTMITLDVSGVMRAETAACTESEIREHFARLPAGTRRHALSEYAGKTFALEGRSGKVMIKLGEIDAMLCAVMYTPALDFTRGVYEMLSSLRGEGRFDLEMSIDETSAPTLPGHHLFIIRELIRRGVHVVSLAPRFIGEFQKGIDYIGDTGVFRKQFHVHALIAQSHGDYKISLHSGSDKFAVFPAVAEISGGRFHQKTAGTSWLEAVRLIAMRDPDLYRSCHDVALRRLPDALKLYHITPDTGRIPAPRTLPDSALPALLDDIDARRVLHVAYGYILNDPGLRMRIFELLDRCEDDHEQLLAGHFERHLAALNVPLRDDK